MCGAYQNAEMPSLLVRRLDDHAFDLVGEFADRHSGSVLPRPPAHLQQYWRNGRKDRRRYQRLCTSGSAARKIWQTGWRKPCPRPISGSACATDAPPSSTRDGCAAAHLELYEQAHHRQEQHRPRRPRTSALRRQREDYTMARILVIYPSGEVYNHDCVRWYRCH